MSGERPTSPPEKDIELSVKRAVRQPWSAAEARERKDRSPLVVSIEDYGDGPKEKKLLLLRLVLYFYDLLMKHFLVVPSYEIHT